MIGNSRIGIAVFLLFAFTLLTPLPLLGADEEVKSEVKAPAKAGDAVKVGETGDKKEPPDEGARLLMLSDSAWKSRQKKGYDVKSFNAAEKALKAGADEFEAQWRIARAAFWVAEWTGSEDEKEKYGLKGWKAGNRAAELKPGRVEGWFWGVVSLGQYSIAVGILKAFFKGLAGDFQEMAEKAIKLDRSYSYGGPSRAYGRYWFKLPAIKRDLERSEKLLLESIKIYPKKLRTHFYLAETYLLDDERDKAKKSLETCLKLDPKNEEYPDGILFQKQCKKLFEKEFK